MRDREDTCSRKSQKSKDVCDFGSRASKPRSQLSDSDLASWWCWFSILGQGQRETGSGRQNWETVDILVQGRSSREWRGRRYFHLTALTGSLYRNPTPDWATLPSAKMHWRKHRKHS